MSVPGDAEGNQPTGDLDPTPERRPPGSPTRKVISVFVVATVLATAITAFVITHPTFRTAVTVQAGVTALLVTLYSTWRNRHSD